MLRTRSSLLLAVAGASVIALSLAGCTVSSGAAAPSGAAARTSVIRDLVERASAQDGVWPERSLSDLLPSHRFRLDGAKAAALAQGIVIGTVTEATPGRGYMIVGDDASSGTQIAFDDPRAVWRVLELTITSDTRLGDVAKTVRVGVVVDGSLAPDEAIAGYLGLGRIALVLNAPGKFDFDPDLYSVRESGSLLALVSKHGQITFPALGADNDDFVGALDTVPELVDEATDAAPVVDVTTDGADLQRSDDK